MRPSDNSWFRRVIEGRRGLADFTAVPGPKAAEEGGCGVVGFAVSEPVGGRHIFEPSIQMHNRGNGKGGGIAAASLVPEQLGVDEKTLRDDYILQTALLDPAAQADIERDFIAPNLEVHHQRRIEPAADWHDLGLEVKPPDVIQYFVRVKKDALDRFASERGMDGDEARAVEDEFIYQNSFKINQAYYASLGEKRAFVMSHARDLVIFKIVGYAENVVKYYGLDDFRARVWIAHQRYPTKGRVWHPAGSHPFIGLNEALVHNGDFANYYSVGEYLRQHNIASQFLTDTEVSVLLFDLLTRVHRYPLEYVIEALAPTTELDFDRLDPAKQKIYHLIQAMHVHASPDGPWFFIIARSNPDNNQSQLLGITDTAMLRPQVFAIQEGDVSIGLVASEKQAIDATLHSLWREDPRFRLVADRYWNARGGSSTDGGAFAFTLDRQNGHTKLSCTDKFGNVITVPAGEYRLETISASETPDPATVSALGAGRVAELFAKFIADLPGWDLARLQAYINSIPAAGSDPRGFASALELLTLINDRRFDCGKIKRSALLHLVQLALQKLLDSVPGLAEAGGSELNRIDWKSRDRLRGPKTGERALVIDARGFEPEGDDSDAHLLVLAYQAGWRRFIVYGLTGQRFHGCGLGPETDDVRLDLYGSSGDYLASGIDGMEVHVHGNGQDQLLQIVKRGKVVIHGDVGQAFMYGAKGGEIFVLGNGAGRPLINAVGRPRVVINGACLDFLAEAFMAGDPHKGGGFVVLNGVQFDDQGRVAPLANPYPGSNLFSLASGGALFVRDPHRFLVQEQLNGGEFAELSERDWKLILPLLQTNEKLFGIEIERDLLTVDGVLKSPAEVYRKVQAVKLAVLAKQSVPE